MHERTWVTSGSPGEPRIGYSRAVRVGNRVVVSGTAPARPDGSCDPDAGAQAARCSEIIPAAVAETGAGAEHLVRTRMHVTDAARADAVGSTES